MSAPTPEQRAAWIAAMRKVLDILEAHPELPLPWAGPDSVKFHTRATYSGGGNRREMAAIEAAIGIEFEARTEALGDIPHYYYVLSGDLDGLRVEIKARAGDVAEERVTGREVIETKEWVRLPVEDETQKPESGEAA